MFRRLESEGFDDAAQDKVLMMSKHLFKIHQQRLVSQQPDNIDLYETGGRLELNQLNLNVPTHVVVFKPQENREFQVGFNFFLSFCFD